MDDKNVLDEIFEFFSPYFRRTSEQLGQGLKDFYNKHMRSKKLSIETYKFWPTTKCWFCKKIINDPNPWYCFAEISGQTYNVPICDDCSDEQGKIFTKVE